MNWAVIFSLFLFSAIAIVSASPFIYIAAQSGETLGNVNNWQGVVMAYVSVRKGTPKYRIRVFGEHNINETVTRAYIQTGPGVIVASLKTSVNQNANLKYIVGDVFLNSTMWQLMKTEQLFVSVASKSFINGSISGPFFSRPHSSITMLFPSYVVGTTPVSSAVGMGGNFIFSASAPSQDLIFNQVNFLTNLISFGRIIHNVTDATGATWNGPASNTANGPVLGSFSALGRSFVLNVTANATEALWVDQEQTYFSVQSPSYPGGEIRGQLYPTTAAGIKNIPKSITNIYGTAVGNIATLGHQNQQLVKNNPQSYIRLVPETIGFNQTQYQGVFNFRVRTTKQNQDGIRGFDLYMNLRGQGQTYLFEMLNAFNSSWTTIGTFSASVVWIPIFAPYYNPDAPNYISGNGYIRIRITSLGTRELLIDSMSIRLYHARSVPAQILRQFTKYLQHLPSQ